MPLLRYDQLPDHIKRNLSLIPVIRIGDGGVLYDVADEDLIPFGTVDHIETDPETGDRVAVLNLHVQIPPPGKYLKAIPYWLYWQTPTAYDLPRAEEWLKAGDFVNIEQRETGTYHVTKADQKDGRYDAVCLADTFPGGMALTGGNDINDSVQKIWIVEP
jgi:hypothetical protein